MGGSGLHFRKKEVGRKKESIILDTLMGFPQAEPFIVLRKGVEKLRGCSIFNHRRDIGKVLGLQRQRPEQGAEKGQTWEPIKKLQVEQLWEREAGIDQDEALCGGHFCRELWL